MRKFFLPLILILFILCNPKFARAQAEVILRGRNGVYTINVCSDFYGRNYIKNEKKVVEDILKKEKVLPKNPKLLLENFTDIKIEAGENGWEVDRRSLIRDLKSAVDLSGGVITLKYNDILPKYENKDIEKCSYLRGTFRTEYAFNSDRVQNIMLATSSINGYMLDAGETFSFNKVVGKRTESRGYKIAKIIVSGEFVEGVGGGVCQASTTLYNSALISGLEIIEAHRHSLLVNYIEPSFDAMVNSESCDLKFKNTTNMPVFLFGKVDSRGVTFKVFGERKNYDIVRESVVLTEIIPKTNTVINSELELGETKVLITPKKGYKSEGYIKKVINGEVVNRTLIRKDSYLAVDGVTEIGDGEVKKENE